MEILRGFGGDEKTNDQAEPTQQNANFLKKSIIKKHSSIITDITEMTV